MQGPTGGIVSPEGLKFPLEMEEKTGRFTNKPGQLA